MIEDIVQGTVSYVSVRMNFSMVFLQIVKLVFMRPTKQSETHV